MTALGVTAYSVDPGTVDTEISRHLGRPLVSITKTFAFLLKTPAEGAYTTIYCVVTPEPQMVTGGYYKSVQRAELQSSIQISLTGAIYEASLKADIRQHDNTCKQPEVIVSLMVHDVGQCSCRHHISSRR